MRYRMKQRLATWEDDYYIENDEQQCIYFVDGKATRVYGKLSFTDLAGNELVYIRERTVALRNTCHIYQKRRVVATIKRLSTAHARFSVQLDSRAPWYTQGNPFQYEYTVLEDQEVVATVSKRWFHHQDTFGVDVPAIDTACKNTMCAGELIKLLVATVVIDVMSHSSQ